MAANDILSVGRVLSAWTTADIPQQALTITYSVYNQQPVDVSGVLLTTTLQPGVTYEGATRPAQQQGPALAWDLGTLPPLGRASVDVTVSFAGPIPLTLDDGARAFGTLDARAVTDDAPPAQLRAAPIDATWLAATPEIDLHDPFILAKAAQLDYDPSAIARYVTQEVGYEAYAGSLRGARGTLWSGAGNALDQASLGIALYRASGIPARYVAGTLSDALAQQLILSMFPSDFRAVGYIPAGAEVADPSHDPQLLAEAHDHYWLEFDAGSGPLSVDPAFADARVGQVLGVPQHTFTAVDDALRHKATFQLVTETYLAADGLLGLGGGHLATVLDQTFNTAELAGRPLTVGHFVQTETVGTPIFSSVTHRYSPFIQIGDAATPDSSDDPVIRGTDYQEVLTNFPLGTQMLTGLFLKIRLDHPGGVSETYERTLADRMGPAVRAQGGVLPPVEGSAPLISPLDLTNVSVLPGLTDPRLLASYEHTLAGLAAEIERFRADHPGTAETLDNPVLAASALALMRRFVVEFQRARTAAFLTASDTYTAVYARAHHLMAYADSPRLTIVQSRAGADADDALQFDFTADLLRDALRVVVSPGQRPLAALSFRIQRGFLETSLETNLLADATPRRPDGTAAPPLSAQTILALAADQEIPLALLLPENPLELERLDLPADVLARLSGALAAGKAVLVPSRPVAVGDALRVGWYEMNAASGETAGLLDDGSHGVETAATYRMRAAIHQAMGFGFGVLSGLTLGRVADFAKKLVIVSLLKQLGPEGAKAAAIVSVVAAFQSAAAGLEKALQGSPELRAFYYGFVLGKSLSLYFLLHDPAVPDLWIGADGTALPTTSSAAGSATVPAGRAGGGVSASLAATSVQAVGQLALVWRSPATGGFQAHTLEVQQGTITDDAGQPIGTGLVALETERPVAVSIAGDNDYAMAGPGALSTYGAAEVGLGISGQWTSHTASVSGDAVLTLTTDALVLNGTPLPAGTYHIATSAASWTGSGATTTPTFAGAAALTVTDGSVHVGPGTGSASVAGQPLEQADGWALSGFSGTLTIAANATQADAIQLEGTAVHVLAAHVTPALVTTDQNTPVTVAPILDTSLAGEYALRIQAPAGWEATSAGDGTFRVQPAPGVLDGVHTVRVVALSTAQPDLITQTELRVAIAPTAPGLELRLQPDPLFYSEFQGAQIPTTFRATVRNTGPAADTFALTYPAVPSGFEAFSTWSTITLGAGETAEVGVYLRPTGALPPPGTAALLSVTATSMGGSGVAAGDTAAFLVPAIHGVTAVSDLSELSTTPGVGQSLTIRLRSVGNVAEHVTTTADLPAHVAISGLVDQALEVGAERTLVVTLTPGAEIPLNTVLSVPLHFEFGGAEPQTLYVVLRVVAPGVEAIARSAATARSIGNASLANRLDNLGSALTRLTGEPGSDIIQRQAVSALDAVIGLLRVDRVLADVAEGLAAPRDALASAGTPDGVLNALRDVGAALDRLDVLIQAVANSDFELFLLPSSRVAQPGTATQFDVRLHNLGRAVSTYQIALGSLPAGVVGQLSASAVTLDHDQWTTDLVVTITPPADEVFAFEFSLDVQVDGAPELQRSAVGTLTARREFLAVVDVTATPAFVDPGQSAAIAARLLNTVNRPQPIRVSYALQDAGGQPVFASAPVEAALDVQDSLVTVVLPDCDTTGLPLGEYRIQVLVTDAQGQPLPGGTGTGHLLVGSLVTATLSTLPTVVPPGDSTLTHTLEIAAATLTTSPGIVVGQAPVSGAADAVRQGDFVYVATNAGISVFDVASAHLRDPQLVHTVAGAANMVRVHDGKLYALDAASNQFVISIYSLDDPAQPALLGATPPIPYAYAINMIVTDDHVYVETFNVIYWIGNGDVFDQNGAVIAIDVADPASPHLDGDAISALGTPAGRDGVNDGVLFNENGTTNDGVKVAGGVDQSGGNRNVWSAVQLDATTMLVVGSTATGSDTQSGSGVAHVVDTSDPANLRVVEEILIPGTVQAYGIAVDGDRALVVGSSGGLHDFFTPGTDGFTGTLVLATLDVSDPQHPALEQVEPTALPSRTIGFPAALGNGLFVMRLGETSLLADDAQLVVIDNRIPGQAVVSPFPVPSNIARLTADSGLIYTASPSGLIIYRLEPRPPVAVTLQVEVPRRPDLTIVPDSFSDPPTQVISGPNSDTLVWDTTLAFGTATKTLTWQSLVSGMQPGEAREVVRSAVVAYAGQDPAGQDVTGQFALPPQAVAAKQILSLSPAYQTSGPGDGVMYALTITNPTAADVQYDLGVLGAPQGWVGLSPHALAPAHGSTQVLLQLISDPFAAEGTYAFIVTATTGGVANSVQGILELAGAPNLPPADPQSAGVAVTLTPASATAGQGTEAHYVVRVTNTGSAADAFALSVGGLPADVAATFDQETVIVPPGTGNFRDVVLQLRASLGAAPGEYPFAVFAQSLSRASSGGEAVGQLTLVDAGVTLAFVQDRGHPGGAVDVEVTNTGVTTDTFDLSLSAPAALVATLGRASVTLGPGASQRVPITIGGIDFAFPGRVALVATAASRAHSAVQASDALDVLIDGRLDVSVDFAPDRIRMSQPGSASFVLNVHNSGTLEDRYLARIISTTGSVRARLVSQDGQPAASSLEFVLPGLASGALQVEAIAEDFGAGRVTVQIRSLTDGRVAGEATASLAVLSGESSIAGFAYVDVNNNGVKDAAELALKNVPLTLIGPESRTVLTAGDGSYRFDGLPAGTYEVQAVQPQAFLDGRTSQGAPSLGQVAHNRFYNVVLGPDTHLVDYNFGVLGVRPNLLGKHLFLASSPPSSQVIERIMTLDAGPHWWAFTADFDALLTAEVALGAGEGAIELYTADLQPVALRQGGSSLTAPIFQEQGYLLHVGTGDAAVPATFRLTNPGPPGAFHRAAAPLDVNGDGQVSPVDALLVINDLNRSGTRALYGANTAGIFVDVTGDGLLSPRDALSVINNLNARRGGEGEAAPAAGTGPAYLAESSDRVAAPGGGRPSAATSAAEDRRLPDTDPAAVDAIGGHARWEPGAASDPPRTPAGLWRWSAPRRAEEDLVGHALRAPLESLLDDLAGGSHRAP